MLTRTDTKARGLADLEPVPPDSVIALIGLCEADPRPHKIDVGVGVFRDAAGNTPILKVMKEAEQRLHDTQVTKAYLGSAGDKRFAELLRPILLGEHAGDPASLAFFAKLGIDYVSCSPYRVPVARLALAQGA